MGIIFDNTQTSFEGSKKQARKQVSKTVRQTSGSFLSYFFFGKMWIENRKQKGHEQDHHFMQQVDSDTNGTCNDNCYKINSKNAWIRLVMLNKSDSVNKHIKGKRMKVSASILKAIGNTTPAYFFITNKSFGMWHFAYKIVLWNTCKL